MSNKKSDIPLNKRIVSSLEEKYHLHKSPNKSIDYSISDSVIDSNPLNPLVSSPIQDHSNNFDVTPNLNSSFTFENVSNNSLDLSNFSTKNGELLPLDDLSFSIHNQLNEKASVVKFPGDTGLSSSTLNTTTFNGTKQAGFPISSNYSTESNWGTISRPFYSTPSSGSLHSSAPDSKAFPTSQQYNSITSFDQSSINSTQTPTLFPSAFNLKPLPPQSPHAQPTGEWSSPSMKKALARIPNKEIEFKRAAYNIALFIIIRFFISFTRNFFPKNFTAYHFEETFYVLKCVVTMIQCVVLYNFARGIYIVCKSVDTCEDLKLTPKQRELLGLPVLSSGDYTENEPSGSKKEGNEEKIDDHSTLPKYSKEAVGRYFPKKSVINLKNFNDKVVPSFGKNNVNYDIYKSTLGDEGKALKENENDYDHEKVLKKRFSERFHIDFDDDDDDEKEDEGFKLSFDTGLFKSS